MLLPFLAVEVCEWDGSACGRVVARLTEESSGPKRLRLVDDDEDGHGEDDDEGESSHFEAVWSTKHARLAVGGRYRLRVLVGPMEVGYRDLLVSKKRQRGGKHESDPFLIKPKGALGVRFRIDEQPFAAGLASLTATPSSVPAGGVAGLAATHSLAPSGEFVLLVAGEPAAVRARPGGGFVVGAPLFLDAANWPAPPAGPVDLLLFRDGVAVGLGRRALTVTPLELAPGSAEQARQTLDGIVGSFGRIGEALADEPGEQEQWLTGLSAALEELVNGSDPRSLAGALAAADPAERRLLDAWFASSGMLDALRQYEGMIADAAAGFEQGGAAFGLSKLRVLASASPGPAARAFRALRATTSFPTDVELSEAMQFYETVKDFGETFVAATNTQFNLYVGVAAGAIGLVRGVPAVAIITAVVAVADFAINKLFVALLPANIDRFELTLASVLLDPDETTDAVLHLDAVNDPPPIGIQDVIGTILSVMGVRDAPAIQSLRDALLQTANYMLGLVQAGISAYAGEHPELQLNTSIGSIPAMRWQTTVTDPTLVDRNSNTRAIIQGLPDQVNWIAQTGLNAHGRGEIFATTVANAFGDDFRNSNIIVVTVEDVQVAVNPATVSLAPGGSQQFTSTVTGATNTAVTWTATGGAIDPQGFYIAGNTPGSYTVTATSVENPTQSGTASVTVRAQIAVAVSPTTVTLTPGQTRQFSSTVTGTPNTAVTWTANGGTISQTGLYTAGQTPGTFSVTATSVADPTVSASATVTINAGGGLTLVPFCFAQDRPPVEFVDRVNFSILDAVGELEYTYTVTDGITYLALHGLPLRLIGFSPANGQNGTQGATLTVRDLATGQSVSATWTWEFSTFSWNPENPEFLGTRQLLVSGPCQEGYVYRG